MVIANAMYASSVWSSSFLCCPSRARSFSLPQCVMLLFFSLSLSLALSVLSPEQLLVFTSSHIASFLLSLSLSLGVSLFTLRSLWSLLSLVLFVTRARFFLFAVLRSRALSCFERRRTALERTLRRRTGRFQTFHSLGIFVRPALPFRKLPPRLEKFFLMRLRSFPALGPRALRAIRFVCSDFLLWE